MLPFRIWEKYCYVSMSEKDYILYNSAEPDALLAFKKKGLKLNK